MNIKRKLVGLIVLTIVVCVSFIILSLIMKKKNTEIIEINAKEQFDITSIKEMMIDHGNTSIYFERTTDKDITIAFEGEIEYDKRKPLIQMKTDVKSEVLYINLVNGHDMGTYNGWKKIIIKIPDGWDGKVETNGGFSNIYMNKIELKEININTSGKAHIENVKADKADIYAKKGMDIISLDAVTSLEAEKFINIEIHDLNDIKAKTVSGEITLRLSKDSKVNIIATSDKGIVKNEKNIGEDEFDENSKTIELKSVNKNVYIEEK